MTPGLRTWTLHHADTTTPLAQIEVWPAEDGWRWAWRLTPKDGPRTEMACGALPLKRGPDALVSARMALDPFGAKRWDFLTGARGEQVRRWLCRMPFDHPDASTPLTPGAPVTDPDTRIRTAIRTALMACGADAEDVTEAAELAAWGLDPLRLIPVVQDIEESLGIDMPSGSVESVTVADLATRARAALTQGDGA